MILAIDTSTATIGLAIYDGSSVIEEISWKSPQQHTVILAPFVQKILESVPDGANSLEAIAVALGPGSFTSLRVGIAFAKGIALGNRLPVIGVPTLDFLAAAQPPSSLPMIAMLQAGRGKMAGSLYRCNKKSVWESDHEISVYTADTLAEAINEPTIICGEMNDELRGELKKRNKDIHLSSPAACLRRCGFLAEIAWKQYKKGDYPAAETLAPIYLHTKDPIPES